MTEAAAARSVRCPVGRETFRLARRKDPAEYPAHQRHEHRAPPGVGSLCGQTAAHPQRREGITGPYRPQRQRDCTGSWLWGRQQFFHPVCKSHRAKPFAIPQKRAEAAGDGKVKRLIVVKHFLQKRCDHDPPAGAVRKCNNPLLLFYAKSDIITIMKDCFP